MKTLCLLSALSCASLGFAVEQSPTPSQSQYPFVYLNCYSTSLKLDDKSLMTTTDGNAYGISYFADEHILMSSGESCQFVVTDVKGEVNEKSVTYVADIPFLSNVYPGDWVKAVPATKESGDWFRLQYDYTMGDFHALFFLEEKEFGFSPVVWLP